MSLKLQFVTFLVDVSMQPLAHTGTSSRVWATAEETNASAATITNLIMAIAFRKKVVVE